MYWTEWFLSKQGNELFAEVEPEYICDRFNLCGLNTEIPHFSRAYKLITDSFDEDLDVATQVEVDVAAKHLYGMIHARYILSGNGMTRMSAKLKNLDFGVCPRVLCDSHGVLPVGLSDIPGERSVKVYCPNCQDVYVSPSKLHHHIDGSYFGTTFPHLFLLMVIHHNKLINFFSIHLKHLSERTIFINQKYSDSGSTLLQNQLNDEKPLEII